MATRPIRAALLTATLAAAILAPATSATTARRVKLSLLPLPKSALGAAGRSLPLSHESGVVSNLDAASNSSSGTTRTFKDLGRVTGYNLTYGDPFTGGSGVTQIASGVDQYRTALGAKKGLGFWRKDDAQITALEPYGIGVTLKALQAPAIGAGHFGYATTLTFPDLPAITSVDEQVADGKYVLDVSVTGGSVSATSKLASKLLRGLDQRLQLAEKGRLRGKPVKLLAPLEAGPPSGGPDLTTLAVTAADLTGPVILGEHAYGVDPAALSAYLLHMRPAGQFADLTQDIEWYATSNEAAVSTELEQAIVASVFESILGSTPTIAPVDLSAIGDNAESRILVFSVNGESLYIGMVGLSRGQASDFVVVSGASPLQASEIQSLARAAASHLDAGVTG
jgi:hypothetical protein